MKFSLFGLSFEFGFNKKEDEPSRFMKELEIVNKKQQNVLQTSDPEVSPHVKNLIAAIQNEKEAIKEMMRGNRISPNQSDDETNSDYMPDTCTCSTCVSLRKHGIPTSGLEREYVSVQVRARRAIKDYKDNIEEVEKASLRNVEIGRDAGVNVDSPEISAAIADIVGAIERDQVEFEKSYEFQNMQPPSSVLH